MSIFTTALGSYVLDEVNTAVAIDAFSQGASKIGLLYDMRPGAMRRDRFTSVAGLNEWDEKAETVAATEDIPVQQYQKTLVQRIFAKTVPISREFIDFEEWGMISDIPRMLGSSAFRTMETNGAAMFNDAANGTTYLAEDGKSIGNDAHTNVDGGNSQDNLFASSAFSMTTIKTIRDATQRWKDYRGNLVDIAMDTLLVPPELSTDAFEATKSEKRPDVANNAMNPYFMGFNVVSWNRLTSSTMWFMIDSMAAKQNALWIQSASPEFFGDGDLFQGKKRFGGYMRFANGCRDWRWIAVATA